MGHYFRKSRNRKCTSLSTSKHGPKWETLDPRGENNDFSILRTGLSWSKFAKITRKSWANNILSLQRKSREDSVDSMPGKLKKIEAKKKKVEFYCQPQKQNTGCEWKKNYSNQQSGPCRLTACQGILFFLLQLTSYLTVHNNDDSAMTYVILGTHLCHATVHYL